MGVPWYFFCQQRTRLKNNWNVGRFTQFQLSHSDRAAEGHIGPVYAIQQYARQLVSGYYDGTVRR